MGEAASPPSPYGVCAHLQRHGESEWRNAECAAIAAAGIRRVRFDLEWWRVQKSPDAPFDFSHYDPIVADCEAAGLVPLLILDGPPGWAKPAVEHLEAYGRFVEAVVAHFGDHFPELEIWNEENLRVFWGADPNAADYAKMLKVAYEAAKKAGGAASRRASGSAAGGRTPDDREIPEPFKAAEGGDLQGQRPDLMPRSGVPRVLFGGTAGVPLDYIRAVYKAGGKGCFDAMAVHPYTHPYPPEDRLRTWMESLRALMAEYGDADKPVILTEMGWPTHKGRVGGMPLLRAGLKAARPEQKTWRIVFTATTPGADGGPPREIAETIAEALPPGSTCEACFGKRLRERLAAGDVDAVVYPFDETFPVDTFEDVRAFVERGGILVDFGGMPMYYRLRETSPGSFQKEGREGDHECLRAKLRIDALGWWMDPALPREGADVRAFPTEAAKAAGFQGDPAGERVFRYQTPKLLRDGDEFIPLLTFKVDAAGDGGAPKEVVAASVTRLAGGGCVVIAGTFHGVSGSCGEENQARYLVRSFAMALAMGVDAYFWYEFRAEEKDPFYSEHHFGLTHGDFAPKPAYGAYRNFVLARPEGSVQVPGPWHDGKREFFFPQWTRPDGVKAGVVWKTGATERRTLRFDADRIRFRDYAGRDVKTLKTGVGEYTVPVGESPVFFAGGELKP